MGETREQLAWRQVGYRAGRAGHQYAAAAVGRRAGESAELSYATGYRIGKRERLRAEETAA